MTSHTLCLNMIVKNESKIIERLLRSVIPIIDTYCICDTGSSDNTVEIITEVMKAAGKPGCVVHEPFRNFGYNRTFALQKAVDWGTYALLLDADMTLVINPSFDKKQLATADGHMILQRNGSLEYKNLRIVRTDIGVRCVGPTHEYYDTGCATIGFLETLSIQDLNDGGCKSTKFERDVALLEEALVSEPTNTRYLFYLGNSYRDLGNNEKATETYKRLLTLGGWAEEKYMSCLSIYNIYKHLGCEREGIRYLVEAHHYSPRRVEHIQRLVNYYCRAGQNEIAMGYFRFIADHYVQNYMTSTVYKEILFRTPFEYMFLLPYHVIISALRTNQQQVAYTMYKIICHHKSLEPSDWFLNNLFFNLGFLTIFTPEISVFQDMMSYCRILRCRGFVFTDKHIENIRAFAKHHGFADDNLEITQ
jgi:tetratricopeptide (TPR) repeat protein